MVEITFTHYGEEREVNCTDREQEIFDIICSVCDEQNILELVRKSDSYVSAIIRTEKYGLADIARFKFTPRAKWIKLYPHFDKRTISSPDDVGSMAEELKNAYQENLKYL